MKIRVEGGGATARVRLASHASWLALLWIVFAIAVFARYAHDFHPLGDWSTFFWARAWLGALCFGLASLAIGLKELAWLGQPAWSYAERSSIALALGVLTFSLGIFVLGSLGFLGRALFFAWPALLLLIGRGPLRRYTHGLSRQWRAIGPRLVFPQSVPHALGVLLIVAGAFALYLQIIAPSNIGFDSRWYHVVIAENYAAAGRIRPFPGGWYLGAYPHLGSWLYTWAFLAPGELKHHLCLATHLEFLLVLATVSSTSVLASRLLRGARLRHGGAALFLFPAIFINGSNMTLGADHVLAFWAAPLGLMLLRYWADANARHGALLGALLGGAVLSKYQAIYFVAVLSVVLAVDLARRRRAGPVLLAALTTLVVASPFWLKNAIAYGDPFYPNLYRWFPDHPLYPGAVARFDQAYWFSGPKVVRSTVQRFGDAARALVEFSFSPIGFGKTPDHPMVFGSLFTLLLPIALWVRPRWRLFSIAGCVHLALIVWHLTLPYDRYLQALAPWMAACVAALLATVWRMGSRALRGAVSLLVALQITWGGDAYLFRSQEMLAALPLRQLGPRHQEHPFARNPYPGEELAEIGARLPKGSLIVGHDFYQSLGVGAPAITDNPDWQGGIEYLQLDTPTQVLRRWLELGGTHILWPAEKEKRALEDLARDTVFGRASVAFTDSSFTVAGYRVAPIIDRPPADTMRTRTRIAWLACEDAPARGVYTPAGLASSTPEKTLNHDDLQRDAAATLAEVNAVWLRPNCDDTNIASTAVSKEFSKVLQTGQVSLWIRTVNHAPSVVPR